MPLYWYWNMYIVGKSFIVSVLGVVKIARQGSDLLMKMFGLANLFGFL